MLAALYRPRFTRVRCPLHLGGRDFEAGYDVPARY